MKVPDRENPIDRNEPMAIAEAFIDAAAVEGTALAYWRRTLWVWEQRAWKPQPAEWLEATLWNWLKEAYALVGVKVGKDVIVEARRVAPDEKKVRNAAKAVMATLRLEDKREMPMWLDSGPERMNPVKAIAFEDVIVDAETGLMVERDGFWFDNGVVQVKYRPEAACHRWMRCLKEWGDGDPEWGILLQRIMGYCLLSYREFQRGFMLIGKPRSGKSTILGLLQRLLGKSACISVSFEDLASSFGMDGLEYAKVLSVPEVEDLSHGRGQAIKRLWNNVVGRDPLTVNAKGVRQVRNVICPAVPIMVANHMPSLPDDGGGFSAKLVILPFEVSYLGREQFDLIEELEGEMEGIAAWAFRGAMQLLQGQAGLLWPIVKGARERMEDFQLRAHPFDQFLNEYFVPDEEGFVPHTYIVSKWEKWVKEVGYSGGWVNTQMLSTLLAEKSAWQIRKGRAHEGVRGIRGLGVKRQG